MNKKQIKIEIEQIPIDEVIGYARNPRKNEKALPIVKSSLQEYGFINPCIIDEDNVLVVGHTRTNAARELGYESIPCIRTTHLTPQQIKAFRIMDNKSSEFAEWDIDLLALEFPELDGLFTGFDQSEIEDILRQEEQEHFTDEDDLPRIPDDDIVSIEGDIWTMGYHRVVCGDSTSKEDLANLLQGETIDLMWSDAPYGISYETEKHDIITNDTLSGEVLRVFLQTCFRNAAEVMNDGACYYLTFVEKEGIAFRQAVGNANLKLSQTLVWVKDSPNLSRLDYNTMHESILYGWKEGKAHYFCEDYTLRDVWDDRVDIDNMKKEEMVEMLKKIYATTDVIDVPKTKSNDLHPTTKPVALIEKCINSSTQPNQNILDQFGGSGSTLIAAEKTNRNAYLMEIEPKYVDVMVKRWQDYTNKDAINQDGKTFSQLKRERLIDNEDDEMIEELKDAA